MDGLDFKDFVGLIDSLSANFPIIGCLANLHPIAFKFALSDKITMLFKRKEHATV